MLCTYFHSSQRAFAFTSAGNEGGKNLAESAQDLERTRKAINVQLAEFDAVKKSLIHDLQNRCEKVISYLIQSFRNRIDIFFQVVVLEIQLDEIKEQYSNVIRNSNNKAQQKKMAFLERNLEQLTLVQKQVNFRSSLSGIEFIYQQSTTARGPEFDPEKGGWDC